MFCGFTIGSALGGLIAAQVLDASWMAASARRRGDGPTGTGAGALADAPGVGAVSRLATGKEASRIAAVLAKIAPTADFAGATFAGAQTSHVSPVREVFSRRTHDRHAAAVARVLHEPARRLSAFELDADADPEEHWRVAEPCGAHRGDVAGRRHRRRDRRRAPDGRTESASRARRGLCVRCRVHRGDQHDDRDAVADGARGLRRRFLCVRRSGRRQRALRRLLSDAVPRNRRELGERDRSQPDRL